MRCLRERADSLPQLARGEAHRVFELETRLLRAFRGLVERRLSGQRIRCHGDYHLGQLLYTGKDFVVIDFEGEPARPMGERRIKRSPMKDVAGMLRSFCYAAYATLPGYAGRSVLRPEDLPVLEPAARRWLAWSQAAFVRGYLDAVRPANLLPDALNDLEVLLDAFVLEKAIYELGYEMSARPAWVRIPLRGILSRFAGTE
jgi:maltose alpha-D-glucosyltransferase/alpha-amylase